ncbi:hypothetical protein AMTR_s00050p00103750 [Amborella trichopoda]|uniref:Uncharacterized protein n=1 Tax=Amborella trichopoda TaxID=13333 RepID=W1PS71_AMBTC|nr:hypothetical protein AMTR_s00050p00103750 [Amborella trichopoda]
MPGYTSTVHRDQYDKLTEEQFTWCPYIDEEDDDLVRTTRVYRRAQVDLILENSLQAYHPKQVLWQFELTKEAPPFVPHRAIDKMKGGPLYAGELQRARDRWV